ncbi:TlpA family protein disulfide reductase [Streptomyces niger]|uniref:TlpA family protein disulfide reductase n=1 Tax=Streptomyces niger TaxID=66373 RepID=UPI00069ADFFC|nr:TlpA disulfide reductase family protein [Streptomyces niger]
MTLRSRPETGPGNRPGTRPATRRRGLVGALLATCAAGSLLSGCADGGSDSADGARPEFVRGKDGFDAVPVSDRTPAPAIDGRTTRGKNLDLDDYRGKVVVLNIWGSWCGPCDAEAPDFAKVARESRGKGVQFVGINTRDGSTAQAVAFEEQHKMPYPSLFDPAGKLMLRFPKGSVNPQLIPTTLVIDRQGRLAARAIGPVGAQQLRTALQPLTTTT